MSPERDHSVTVFLPWRFFITLIFKHKTSDSLRTRAISPQAQKFISSTVLLFFKFEKNKQKTIFFIFFNSFSFYCYYKLLLKKYA